MMLDQWLDARGLDPELAAKMGWAFVNHRELGPAVRIPYIRDGKMVTAQYRSLGEKAFRFPPNSDLELWNCDILKDGTLDGDPLIIAEGACDGLALIQCGFVRTVSVPGATSITTIEANEAAIARAKKIIIAQHADDAGAKMLRDIANIFEEQEVCYVRWPDDCKDANDTLKIHGQKAVVSAISRAKQLDPPGGVITGFSDAPPRAPRHLWRLDYPEVDKVMAFRSRAISALTGRPGEGKTTFMTWVCHHLVRANNVRIGLCLFETEAQEVFFHLARLKGKEPERMTEAELDALKAELDQHYRIVHRVDDNETMHGMNWLCQMIRKLAVRDRCSIIVIDPWNELEHTLERGETLSGYMNLALKKMRQWAEKYDVHICIVAHPRKMADGERANGYHISDSAAWVNKVDTGWTVALEPEKDGLSGHVSLNCWKVRSRQQTGCKLGRVRLQFDEYSMTYSKFREPSAAFAPTQD